MLTYADLINLKLNDAFSAPKKPSPTASETELAKFIADRLRLAEEAQVKLLPSPHASSRIITHPLVSSSILTYPDVS